MSLTKTKVDVVIHWNRDIGDGTIVDVQDTASLTPAEHADLLLVLNARIRECESHFYDPGEAVSKRWHRRHKRLVDIICKLDI